MWDDFKKFAVKSTDKIILSTFKQGLHGKVKMAVLAANPAEMKVAVEISMSAEASMKDTVDPRTHLTCSIQEVIIREVDIFNEEVTIKEVNMFREEVMEQGVDMITEVIMVREGDMIKEVMGCM